MTTIIVIVIVCLILGLLVLPWLTRSLNRARHASSIKQPGYGGKVSGHFGGLGGGVDRGGADGGNSGEGEQP